MNKQMEIYKTAGNVALEQNSLLTGKRTGNSVDFAKLVLKKAQNTVFYQPLAEKFPDLENREF